MKHYTRQEIMDLLVNENDEEEMSSWVSQLTDDPTAKSIVVKKISLDKVKAQATNKEDADKLRSVAIKQLKEMSKLKHENIIHVYTTFVNDADLLHVIMRYCEDGTLETLLANLKEPLTELTVKYFTCQIASALKYLHDLKIIHRDIKSDVSKSRFILIY